MVLPNSKISDLRGRNLRLETYDDAMLYVGGLDANIVEEIYLADVTFGVGAAEALGEVIKKIKHLKVAGLSDIFIGRSTNEVLKALPLICDALIDKPSLVDLDLSNNAIGARVVDLLVPLLTHNRHIEVLKLNNNGFGPEAGTIVANALIEAARLSTNLGQTSQLRVVMCGRNRLENESATAWARAFAVHPNLQQVELQNNGIREEGFGAILRGLACCGDLRYLNLRDNNSMDAYPGIDFTMSEREHHGWQALNELLPAVRRLRFLDLSDCGLNAPGSMALVHALAEGHQKELETLLLENNDIVDNVYKDLASVLSDRLPALTMLSLACNEDLESDVVSALNEMLEVRGGRVVIEDEDEDLPAEKGVDAARTEVPNQGRVGEDDEILGDLANMFGVMDIGAQDSKVNREYVQIVLRCFMFVLLLALYFLLR